MNSPNYIEKLPADRPEFLPPSLLHLKQEIITYRRHLPRFLAEGREGQYVLMKADRVLGFYDVFDGAFEDGVDRFGLEPFMAHRITTKDLTAPWPREVDPPEPEPVDANDDTAEER